MCSRPRRQFQLMSRVSLFLDELLPSQASNLLNGDLESIAAGAAAVRNCEQLYGPETEAKQTPVCNIHPT